MRTGRIAYYDRQTKLYNVVGMEDRQWWGGQYRPSSVRILQDLEPEPWYTLRKKKVRSDLTAPTPGAIITQVSSISPNQGGDMAKRKAVEVDDLDDDLDDLDDPVEDEDEAPKRKAKAGAKGKAKTKKDEGPKGIGAKQVADRLKIEGKTFRAWLRRQVAAGEIKIPEREGKDRYDFGADWNAPLVQKILTRWEESSHEAGENLKKAQAARKAKKAEAEKAPAKKAVAGKKAVAKKKSR
jgi:hypothetical protein